MFYHGPHNHCSSGDSCKYSHAPITDEIREILKKVSSLVFLVKMQNILPNMENIVVNMEMTTAE